MATPQPVDARTQPWRETPGGDLVALGRPVRQALHLVRHNPAQGRVLSRRETILLVLFALTLHGAVIHWLSQQRTPALPEVPPQVPPM
ncbi:energy transducer TonB, partial [Pseudomonas aeruginosa]|nr:energy transducer TonB [Pseudomonas aeruginosa]